MKKRLLAALAAGTIGIMALAGCSSNDDNGGSGDGGSGEGPSYDTTENGDRADLAVNVFNGWPEGIATSYLWQTILADKGYDVSLEYSDAGIGFAALDKGDYDLNMDVWLPGTHAEYWDKFGDDLEQLGTWYEDAPLTIAVNADAPIDSLAELADHADEFDNTLFGIEPGSGLNGVTQDSAIPTYGLEDMEYIPSSTPAMLAALKKGIEAGDNVVVTLWKPHWAYSAFPLKDLEDPEGAMGEPDGILSVGRAGFTEEYPQLAEWLKDFTFPDDKLASLDEVMFNPGEGDAPDEADYPELVEQWIADNQEWVDSLTAE